MTAAIAECEQEGEELEKKIALLEHQLKEVYQKLADYRTALNHTKNTPFSTGKKAKNARFITSPQKLVANILKSQPDKWLNTNEITRQAMKLDGQKIGHTLPNPQPQTVYTVLRYLMEKGLVEKGWIEEKCHWRLKAK